MKSVNKELNDIKKILVSIDNTNKNTKSKLKHNKFNYLLRF